MSTRRGSARWGLVAAFVGLTASSGFGCGGAARAPEDGPLVSPSSEVAEAPSEAPSSEPSSEETSAVLAPMLEKVRAARGLPVKRPVASKSLGREALSQFVRDKVAREVPPEVLTLQGELLTVLGLLEPDYDFLAGAFALLGGRIAGLYEPEDQTMYLVDDLDPYQARETLAHELVHALQDQSWPLAPLIKYQTGEADRIAAAHALVEGDATSAMLDVMVGSAFNLSDDDFRRIMALSTALSAEGAATPSVLQASLTSPYTDGFAFVQELRRRGGWEAVNRAWDRKPTTTEQLLHVDKYEAREPALEVPAPTVDALGDGFSVDMVDSFGEQSLRIALAEWSSRPLAEAAAAGWGGDRYVIARRGSLEGTYEVAVALRLHMDSEADAKEVEGILSRHLGGACRERANVGPMAWQRVRSAVTIAAGPFERSGRTVRATGDCALARRWLAELTRGAAATAPRPASP